MTTRSGRAQGEFVTVVRHDGRGTGLSQREAEDVSLEANVRDLEAAIETLRSGPVALMGVFHSSPASMVNATLHPERISHLIPWCSYARGEENWRSNRSEGLRVLRQADYQPCLRTVAHELLGWADDEVARRAPRASWYGS